MGGFIQTFPTPSRGGFETSPLDGALPYLDAPWCWNMNPYIHPENDLNVGKTVNIPYMEHIGHQFFGCSDLGPQVVPLASRQCELWAKMQEPGTRRYSVFFIN